MAYVKIADGAVVAFPYSVAMLAADHPTISLPRGMTDAALADWGIHPVTVAAEPSTTATQIAVRDAEPALVDGIWTLGWTVRDKTAGELAEDRARTQTAINVERDRRLSLGKGFTPTGHGAAVSVNIHDEPNLTGLTLIATSQVAAGNGAGTMVWRDNDNVNHTLTYSQVAELHGLAGAYQSAVYAAAWTLKDADPIPANYTADEHWPS